MRSILNETGGVAAAEFALVLPILVVMLFFFWEYGRFVEGTHAVNKAVRDGARFAARKPWVEFGCGGSLGETFDEEAIKTYVVTSLSAWQAANTDITVGFDCVDYSTGIYAGLPPGGTPVVFVEADVPYRTLFGGLAGALGLGLRGRSQSAVMGI